MFFFFNHPISLNSIVAGFQIQAFLRNCNIEGLLSGRNSECLLNNNSFITFARGETDFDFGFRFEGILQHHHNRSGTIDCEVIKSAGNADGRSVFGCDLAEVLKLFANGHRGFVQREGNNRSAVGSYGNTILPILICPIRDIDEVAGDIQRAFIFESKINGRTAGEGRSGKTNSIYNVIIAEVANEPRTDIPLGAVRIDINLHLIVCATCILVSNGKLTRLDKGGSGIHRTSGDNHGVFRGNLIISCAESGTAINGRAINIHHKLGISRRLAAKRLTSTCIDINVTKVSRFCGNRPQNRNIAGIEVSSISCDINRSVDLGVAIFPCTISRGSKSGTIECTIEIKS